MTLISSNTKVDKHQPICVMLILFHGIMLPKDSTWTRVRRLLLLLQVLLLVHQRLIVVMHLSNQIQQIRQTLTTLSKLVNLLSWYRVVLMDGISIVNTEQMTIDTKLVVLYGKEELVNLLVTHSLTVGERSS